MNKNGELTKHELVYLVILAALMFLPKFIYAVYPGSEWIEAISSWPLWYVYIIVLVVIGSLYYKTFVAKKTK